MKTLSHNDLRNEYLLSLTEFFRSREERDRDSLNKAGAELIKRGQTCISTALLGTIAIKASQTTRTMKIPTLETSASTSKSRHALAAANIRRELRVAFPAHKFAIHSRSFAGGDSIAVRWTLGPTEREVSAITDKYQTGSFDGMVDLYTYDTDRTFTATHGGSKYVQTSRDTDGAIAPIIRDLRASFTSELSDYEAQTYAYRILAKHAFPVGATITGLQSTDRTGGLVEDIFAPTFTVNA